LLTQKAADLFLFKKALQIVNNKSHLSIEGLNQLIDLKASMNLGLSDWLKLEFKKVNPVERLIINTETIPNPNWISGFVSAEGNFDVRIPKLNSKLGYRVQLRFRITQHYRDKILLENIIKYLGSGKLYIYPNYTAVSLVIVNFSDINNIIIPFFEKNPLLLRRHKNIRLFRLMFNC
jgi:hypothetical protein